MNKKLIEAYTTLKEHWIPIQIEIDFFLDEITNPIDKIKYLQSRELTYYIDVLMIPELIAASGQVTAGNPHKAGLDGWIELRIKQIKNEFGIEDNNIPKKLSVINSYKWRYPDELEKLFELMNGEFIDECDFIQFKDAFSNKPINKIKPMKWIKAKNLLAYFIDQSYNYRKIQIHINPDKWKIASSIFSNAGSNLSQSLQDCKMNPEQKPKNYLLIDELFKTL